MTASSPTFDKMPGREVLARAIDRLEYRAELGRASREAYGLDAYSAEASRDPELDTALATFLAVLLSRGSTRVEDLPKDKEGKPQFVAKLRHETTLDLVQLAAGSLRAAFVKFPVQPETETQNAA